MLVQMLDVPTFWRKNKFDAIVWVGTFLATTFISMDLGVAAGIVLNLISIFFRGMQPYTCLMGRVPNTDLYLDMSRYKAAIELPNIKIFHYTGALNFCTTTLFKAELYKKVKPEDGSFQHLVIDFTGLTYVDPTGVEDLAELETSLTNLNVSLSFAGTPCEFKVPDRNL